MVTDRGRDTTEQRRNLGTCLGKAKDIIDKEEHILAFLITEIFSNSQRRQCNAGTGSRGLVHLTVNQSRLVENAGVFHLMPEIVALTGPLTDTGENRITAVLLTNVVDQLHDQNGLADTCTAEQADLAATSVGRKQVDDFDPGFKRFNVS